MTPEVVAGLIANGILFIIQIGMRGSQEREKEERQKAEKRLETLEAKIAVYREEQVRDQGKLQSIDEKLDRVLLILEDKKRLS